MEVMCVVHHIDAEHALDASSAEADDGGMTTKAPTIAGATRLASSMFPIESIVLDGVEEHVVRGGRRLFATLPDALRGVERIGVLGWGPQARAQAQNLRDALAGTAITVTVGLRPGSPSRADAERCGFREADGTLGDLLDVAAESDLVLLLISDAAQVEIHEALFARLRPGTTLGLSHGFLVGWLRATGRSLPEDVNVIAVCPKGMGVSVRGLFEQGADADGAGINVSVAVEQDLDGWATDIALAWAIAIGAPFVFATTMEQELRSDVFGERGVLLGAVHGLAESAYLRLRAQGVDEEEAYLRTAQATTGPIAATISHEGIAGVIARFGDTHRADFERAYAATYHPVRRILEEIYDEVASGREIEGVIDAGARLAHAPMAPLEGTAMWEVGKAARQRRDADAFFDAETAGAFVATMIAQVDVLRDRGHSWSEIANESVIEAVDSLLPYMHARGVAYMIDNCSVTARLGARRWGPIFEAAYRREVFPAIDSGANADQDTVTALRDHPVHGVLDALRDFRPSVDIAVR
jgi:ketol-acid reductoisomerase